MEMSQPIIIFNINYERSTLERRTGQGRDKYIDFWRFSLESFMKDILLSEKRLDE